MIRIIRINLFDIARKQPLDNHCPRIEEQWRWKGEYTELEWSATPINACGQYRGIFFVTNLSTRKRSSRNWQAESILGTDKHYRAPQLDFV